MHYFSMWFLHSTHKMLAGIRSTGQTVSSSLHEHILMHDSTEPVAFPYHVHTFVSSVFPMAESTVWYIPSALVTHSEPLETSNWMHLVLIYISSCPSFLSNPISVETVAWVKKKHLKVSFWALDNNDGLFYKANINRWLGKHPADESMMNNHS